VYVFLLGGCDPLDLAGLSDLRDDLFKLGFPRTYCGQVYHAFQFGREIRRVHHEDPDARFVLVGHGLGCRAVVALAESAQREDIAIDLVACLDGKAQEAQCQHDSDHACEVWHHGSPGDAATLHLLSQQLVQVACRVPIVAPAFAPPPIDPETAPTPRPVQPRLPAERPGEWDFLQPVSVLQPPPEL
jgi:hypothetical protein